METKEQVVLIEGENEHELYTFAADMSMIQMLHMWKLKMKRRWSKYK